MRILGRATWAQLERITLTPRSDETMLEVAGREVLQGASEEDDLLATFSDGHFQPSSFFILDDSRAAERYPGLEIVCWGDEISIYPGVKKKGWWGNLGVYVGEDWLRAMLKLVTARVDTVLRTSASKDPDEVSVRLNALVDSFTEFGPSAFFADEASFYDWGIASHWREWAESGVPWGERCLDLDGLGFGNFEIQTLRRRSRSLGLNYLARS